MKEQQQKVVVGNVSCPKCGKDVRSYIALAHSNEQARLVFNHDDGKCDKWVDLIIAHRFERDAKLIGPDEEWHD